jgi:serine/threonine protein kinase
LAAVLPSRSSVPFAFDPDRISRFEREAKLIASLNHPNIAALHGMDVSNGTHFLVMELIEGETAIPHPASA